MMLEARGLLKKKPVMSHSSKVALVTGGTRGMGREMVRALLDVGMTVIAVARRTDGLEVLADTLSTERGRLAIFSSDLAAKGAPEKLVAQIMASHGRIDVLVNNAGIGSGTIKKDSWQRPVPFWDVKPEQWHDFIAINSDAPFLLARAVVSQMIDRKWGRLISVTTSLNSMINAGRIPYGPSKAATEAAAAVMAADLAGTGVTSNVLVPGGPVNTEFVPLEAGLDREAMLQPSIMVEPLKWLVSNHADGFTARRIVAAEWKPAGKDPLEMSSPIAGMGLGRPVIVPKPQ
jgi:NAD(P)-dependent dehydrogenase (short-subunit alcohol dehydrogenase family)